MEKIVLEKNVPAYEQAIQAQGAAKALISEMQAVWQEIGAGPAGVAELLGMLNNTDMAKRKIRAAVESLIPVPAGLNPVEYYKLVATPPQAARFIDRLVSWAYALKSLRGKSIIPFDQSLQTGPDGRVMFVPGLADRIEETCTKYARDANDKQAFDMLHQAVEILNQVAVLTNKKPVQTKGAIGLIDGVYVTNYERFREHVIRG